MRIEIKILRGRRQGNTFELPVIDFKENSEIFVLEDEVLELSFYSDKFYDKITLALHENEIAPTLVEDYNGAWVYKWLPKRTGAYAQECFFHNYYGIAELSLELFYEGKSEIVNFNPLEVLAKKINAERVEKMLSFLAKTDSEALCSFFRVTRRKAGYQDGDTPVDILLEQVENTVEKTSSLIKKLVNAPITKLSNREKYVYPNDSTNVDDLTLSWLCNNADELFEVDCIDSAILEFNNCFYGVKKLIELQAIEDSDVYENQVLHGFINTLIHTTSMLLSGFEFPEKKTQKFHGGPDGYLSFFSQIQKFQKNINARKVEKCKSILSTLHSVKKLMPEKIPSKKAVTGIPIFTMKAKKESIYLSIFRKIVDWYRFGRPDWSVQDELLSIQSIPKLFEYYTLFYIKSILDHHFSFKSLPENNNGFMLFEFPIKQELKLSFLYEPKYWMARHSLADLRGLVNSEGWTIYNGKVSKRSSSGKNSNRSPDYVIKISNALNNERYVILDAKYTTTDKAFTHYLPDLTLKYIHGLNLISKTHNPIIGLMIINPDNNPQVRDFHNSVFELFSDTPAMPFLQCATITPGEEFRSNNKFENSLLKMLELTEIQLKKDIGNSYQQITLRA
ncbi:DUF2357 domain-containing protein [Serratia sp. IR-2025]